MKARRKTKNKTGTKTKSKAGAKPKVSKKEQKKKIIITSLAVGAAGILGFFGWQYWKRKKQSNGFDIDAVLKESNNTITTPVDFSQTSTQPKPTKANATGASFNTPKETPDFPLKKGSKGDLVKELQEALIAKYGKSTLPKYGADGDFGTETANALKKAGLPASIDQSTFNVIVAANKVDSTTVGKEMYVATIARNFDKLLSSLKKLKTTDDYSQANEVFKTYRINGVRQTIVNGLLNTFAKADQKEKIKFEFLRMGLQYDGSKWSLSGLDGLPLITKESTTVWVNAKEGVKVPARMVLGNEISRRLDYTLFENKGKYFLVNTNAVKYL